jgi:hypothetical protein
MANTTVAPEIHKALNIHRNLAPKVTFNTKGSNSSTKRLNLGFGKVSNLAIARNTGCLADLFSCASTNSKNCG